MSVRPPQVITKESEDGRLLEHYEEVKIDCDLEYVSGIIDKMNERKGILMDIQDQKDGRQLVKFRVPTRGLLGFRNMLTTDTKGTAQLTSQYLEHDEYAGDIKKNNKCAIIQCVSTGETTAYALRKIEEKGVLFVGAGVPTYEGMVIGEHVLESDMEMNAVKAKELSNMRVSGFVEQVERLSPPRIMGLEDAVAYIRDDELVEVTPKFIRIRKQILSQGERERMARQAKNEKMNKKK